MKALRAYPVRERQENAKLCRRELNTRCANPKVHSRCLPHSPEGLSLVRVAALRTFRPIPALSIGRSYTRLSRRFDPEFYDRSNVVSVAGMYKRKAQKVSPVNQQRRTGDAPGGEARWKQVVLEMEKRRMKDRQSSKWDKWIIPRFAETPEGTRLTPERIEKLHIGKILRPAELELLIQVLKNREMVLAWTFKEIGRIRPEVAPPQEIHTIEHVPWQASNFPIPRALRKVICDMLRERLERGILEYC
jgi:hypothetical protein